MAVCVWALPDDSALHREMEPEEYHWTLDRHLLAEVVHGVRVLAWQNTKDGEKGRNQPEPIWRPGVEKPTSRTVLGAGEGLPLDEMADWLGWSKN